jgi:hypothetical protein
MALYPLSAGGSAAVGFLITEALEASVPVMTLLTEHP